MTRAIGIAKTIGSLLAIEMFVPGGTLIILTLLLTGRRGSPLSQMVARRIPSLSRFLIGLTGNPSCAGNAGACD